MIWILLALLALVLLAGASLLFRRFLARLFERTIQAGLLEELKAGLAIPMRAADTRRSHKEQL